MINENPAQPPSWKASSEEKPQVLVLHSDGVARAALADVAVAEGARPLCPSGDADLRVLVDTRVDGLIGDAPLLKQCKPLLERIVQNSGAVAFVLLGVDSLDHMPGSLLTAPALAALSTSSTQQAAIEAARLGVREACERFEDRRFVERFYRELQTLSPDEREVMESVCSGKLNKQIARELKVSVRTVEQRRRRVFNKMGAESAIPLAARLATVRTIEEHLRRAGAGGRGGLLRRPPAPNAGLGNPRESGPITFGDRMIGSGSPMSPV